MDKIKLAINLYERAKNSKNKLYVTYIARKIVSPRSHHLKDFKYKHFLWGDIDKIYIHPDIFTPFPLAWKFSLSPHKYIWVYGWADLIYFKNQIPIEVYEVKQYSNYGKYDEVQLKIYGLLAYKIFDLKPRLFLVQQIGRKFTNLKEIEFENIEKKVLEVLSKL